MNSFLNESWVTKTELGKMAPHSEGRTVFPADTCRDVRLSAQHKIKWGCVTKSILKSKNPGERWRQHFNESGENELCGVGSSDCDLSPVDILGREETWRRSQCLPPPPTTEMAAPGSWERGRAPDVDSVRPLKTESEKWKRKLLIPTAETWGHAVRSYKGIKASLFRRFLSGQLISWHLMQAVRRTAGLDITYSTSHKSGAPTEH